jgi:hypothetical protein
MPPRSLAAPPLAHRTRLARPKRVSLCRNVFPPIHVLPNLDKNALARGRLAELLNVQLGKVAHPALRDRQRTY